MAYTSHGHHIPGTVQDAGDRPPIARCGGPKLCSICAREAHNLNPENTNYVTKSKENTMELVFKEFVRKPFTVDAVEVTAENIEEIAKSVGTLSEKQDGTPYIQVDRRLIPNVFRVYPGFWMTKMGDNVRCYSRRVFSEQFTETTLDIKEWVEFINNQPINGEDATTEVETDDDSGATTSDKSADAGIVED